jgi:malonyl CoA-acyl carrier protein transacylase
VKQLAGAIDEQLQRAEQARRQIERRAVAVHDPLLRPFQHEIRRMRSGRAAGARASGPVQK